jgi:uncharacterized protein (TIGR02600 family)
MNPNKISQNKKARRQAMALVMVVTTVALISMLIVAIFSVTRTEYKATQNYVAARSAKQLADTAVAITQAQLQNAQNSATNPTDRTIHATQPGMARVYSSIGNFIRAHKLYSSSQMVVTSAEESDIFAAQHQVPQDWNSAPNKARFVDLNEPVVRPGLTAGTTSVYYPVIDPRAAYTGVNPSTGQTMTAVDGFSYSRDSATITGAGGAVSYNEVVTQTDAGNDPNKLRLPMPVEWIYLLQDGTTGALDASNKFISSEQGKEPSAINPIVGRVAFWTDDESCKVNINTASEPTFFAPPYFYHQRDYKWANFPPAAGEYQRYPGHPATVALSPILAPGIDLDPLAPGAGINNIVETKEFIYNLIPKIAMGGSKSGTLPFLNDAFSAGNGEQTAASGVDNTAAKKERLFASVDEMLFRDGVYGGNGREAARYVIPGQNNRLLFDHDTLERSRFFLTAHSRAPEFSNHGLPRIAMWPVADEGLGQNFRSSFDNMIALCATLRNGTSGAAINNSYIFRRAQPHHPSHDVTGSSSTYGSSQGLSRNSKLLDYLYSQMDGLQFPRTSSLGSSGTYSQKYGQQNTAQLAVQFYDYIRSTNLYDGVLARENDGISGAGLSGTAFYERRDQIVNQRRTYTEQRVTRKASGSLRGGAQNDARLGNDILSDDAAVFPGHGQVTPAVWQKGNTSYRGFGRMFTLSEVGFHFICTADGKNDQYAANFGGVLSGGGSAPRTDPTTDSEEPTFENDPLTGQQRRWYSNFPPLLRTNSDPPNWVPPPNLYGALPTPPGGPRHPSRHPGYNPNNWNMTLANRVPLLPDEKRIQAMFLMEAFCPMLGWTKMHPEYAIVLDGNFIGGIKLNNQRLFDTTQDIVVKSNGNLFESHDVYSSGGHAGPTAMAGNRGARPVSGGGGTVFMASDGPPPENPNGAPLFNTGNTSGHNALANYGLNTNFVTVKRNQPMQLSFDTRELVIKIYDKHRYQEEGLQPVQIIRIAFENSPLPVPALVYSQQRVLNGAKVNALRNELNYYQRTDSFGRITYWRSLQGPHWWCFNNEGCLGRMNGSVNPNFTGVGAQPFWQQNPNPYPPGEEYTPLRQVLRGRLNTTSERPDGPPGTPQGFSIIPFERTANPANTGQFVTDEDTGLRWTGSDVIRTMVPAVGDYRLIAARYEVPATMWMRHPVWTKTIGQGLRAPRSIHSFTTHVATTEEGVVLPTTSVLNNPVFTSSPPLVSTNHLLVVGAPYSDARIPDLPPDTGWAAVANSYGDFDNGIANSRDGAYVNKPDEGNFYAGNFSRHNKTQFYRSGYFYEPWRNSDDWRTGVYMTPNRIVTSPVMFGSLSTGVWGGGSVTTNALASSGVTYNTNQGGKPWQTLLFRPYARSHATLGKSVTTGHPGDHNPRDHNLLDLFFMPVVEPYAISEPLSSAGRINLNYQIMPFTNIIRATGMHALMKGEFMTAIPRNDDVNKSKTFQTAATAAMWNSTGDRYWGEQPSSPGGKKLWHRPIDVTKTLYQFEQKFRHSATGANHALGRFRGLFRSASQICEIHLIPDFSEGFSDGEALGSVTNITPNTNDWQEKMDEFWQNHSPTGDNTRERPYSNLYARVTTRSNTFRVHMRAQVLRKARSVAADVVDPAKDAVLGEYRGSALIERYIDPTDTLNPIPDYAASTNPLNLPPLETFYKFRTLESKRFSP